VTKNDGKTKKSAIIVLMLICLLSTPTYVSASTTNAAANNSVNELTSNNGTAESTSGEAYSGDDEYYIDDGLSEAKDYYNENGSPNSAGNSAVNKYAELDNATIIESINTSINVAVSNIYTVTKEVKVYYNTEAGHTITMKIPINNSESSGDSIKDVKVRSDLEGTKFETSISEGNFNILINDLTTGLVYANYIITYDHVSNGDESKKYDLLTQDLIGFYDSPVYKLNFSILMPSKYEQKELEFTDINGMKLNIFNSIENSTLSGYYDNKLENGSVVIALKISDGYFNSTAKTGFIQTILMLLSTLCVLMIMGGFALSGLSYYKFGRSQRILPLTQRKPIEGLSPVDIIVALTGSTTNENIMLYILQLANEGYIAIKDRTYKHQRNRNPANGYDIRKIKNYDGDDINAKEFMKIIFKNSDSVTPVELSNTSYKLLNHLRIKIQDRGVKNLWEIDNAGRKLCSNIGLIIPLLVSLLLSLYNLEAGLSLKTLSVVYGPITAVLIYMLIKTVDKLIKKRNMMRGGVADTMTWIYVFSTTAVVLAIAGSFNNNMFSKHSILMTLAYLVEIILIYCSCNMKKRTEKGIDMCGRILGFRQFMVESNEIAVKRAVLKDEQYIYKSLPYAIALDVAKGGWLSVMDSCYIDNPAWYESSDENEFRLVDFMKDWHMITSAILEEPSMKKDKDADSNDDAQ